MKSYTDIEQSRKLKKILPIESADMLYVYDRHLNKLYGDTPYVIGYKVLNENVDIPCWSLAALLEIIKRLTAFYLLINNGGYRCHCRDKSEWKFYDTDDYCDTPIDACVEIIIKLHEQKLL